ncbi:MAG: hypothetical protein AB7I57_25250 [Pirellulales bacterium]
MKRLIAFAVSCLIAAPCSAADITMEVDTDVTIPVNILALTDDTDFKTRETAVAFDAAGLDLVWNFVTPAGVITQEAFSPTNSGGSYDWTHVGDGQYKIEIPASSAGIANDTTGYGWVSGTATGVLPWRGPIIEFVPANVVNSVVKGTDKLEVDATQVAGNATAAANLGEAFDGDTTGGPFLASTFGVTGASTFTGRVDLDNGLDVACTTANQTAIKATGNGTGHGMEVLGGSGDGAMGLLAGGSLTNGYGIYAGGNGTGSGLIAYASGSGPAVLLQNEGGGGNGLKILTTSAHGVEIDAFGVEKHGIFVQGGLGASGTGAGIKAVGINHHGVEGGFTGDITGNLTGTIGALATQAKADVRAEANGALEDKNLDHLLKVAAAAGDIVNDSVIAKLVSKSATAAWTTYNNTTDSLEAQRDNFDAALNGAPTFAQAMDEHGYTVARAEKIDKLAPTLLVNTTISGTPSSPTTFVIAARPPDNDALNGALVLVTKQGEPTQKVVGLVKKYVGSTRIVTLLTDPEIFTFANGDSVDIIASGSPAALWLGSSP